MFGRARTRVAVLEILKDDLVTTALHDPMDSRTANGSAWAQMAGVVMRFSNQPGYRDFQPPSGLSPRQRAIWIVYAFSNVVARSSPRPELTIALNVAVSTYAELHGEATVANRAQESVDRLLAVTR